MPVSRREFLKTSLTVAAATGAWPALPGTAADTKSPPIVDCHTHFYDPTRPEGIPWPGPNDRLLYRTVLPRHFLEQGAALGVTKTVVVEASPRVADNAWLLELARENKSIVGVVGNLAPGKAEFAKNLQRFAANSLFRGIRIGHDALRAGLDRPEFLADLKQLAAAGLELDINGGPELPADAARLAAQIPDLTIVINHLANLPIDGQAPPEGWVLGMQAAARQRRVFCKVSALVESARPRDRAGAPANEKPRAPTDVDFYRPVLDAIWKIFGDDRLIFGSNWPVSDVAASYADLLGIVRQYVTARGQSCAEKFFSANSVAAYRYPV
jgi:L-fuconolactonase